MEDLTNKELLLDSYHIDVDFRAELIESRWGHFYKVRVTHMKPEGHKRWMKLSRPFIAEADEYSPLERGIDRRLGRL